VQSASSRPPSAAPEGPRRDTRKWILLATVVAFALVGVAFVAVSLAHKPSPAASHAAVLASGAGTPAGQSPSATAATGSVAPGTAAATGSPAAPAAPAAPPKPRAPKKGSSAKGHGATKKPAAATPVGGTLPPGYKWVLRINGGSSYSSGYLDLDPGIVKLSITVMKTNNMPLTAEWQRYPASFTSWWQTAGAVNGMSQSVVLTVSTAGRYKFAVKCQPGVAWALRAMQRSL
jgi:hypothetical protein